MELYDSKYVYFDWDDKLEGKECFVADYIDNLKWNVNNNSDPEQITHNKDNDSYPFREKDTEREWCFAYYDPNYEVKKALLEGKDVQYYRKEFNKWTDLHLTCSVEDYLDNEDWDIYEWRIKPDDIIWKVVLSDEGVLGIAKTTDKHVYFEGIEEECSKWINEHNNFADIMWAWEREKKSIQFYDDYTEKWRDCMDSENEPCEPNWKVGTEYRIKEEYVPFDTIQGLITKWESMNPGCTNRPKCAMPMIWVKSKATKGIYLLDGYDFEDNAVGICDAWFTLENMFKGYTFLNDSIIGKVKEE